MSFQLTVISYHFVGDPLFPRLHTLSFEKFKRQLDFVQKKYAVISWPRLLRFLEHTEDLPKNPCLLTFDDGTKDHSAVAAPELAARGLSGLFFVLGRRPEEGLAFVHLVQYLTAKLGETEFQSAFHNECDVRTKDLFLKKEAECLKAYPTSRYDSLTFRTFKRVIGKFMFDEARPVIERLFEKHIGHATEFGNGLYLSDNDIRSLIAYGMHIGGHGVEHRWMTALGSSEKEDEIKKSAERIKKFNPEPYAFSYPYGDYDATLFPILEKYHFRAAFAGQEKTEHEHPLVIYRLDTNSLPQ